MQVWQRESSQAGGLWLRFRSHRQQSQLLVVVSGRELDAIRMQREISNRVANVEDVELVLLTGLPKVDESTATTADTSNEMAFGMQRETKHLAVHTGFCEMCHRLLAGFPINHTERRIADTGKRIRDIRDATGGKLLSVFRKLH